MSERYTKVCWSPNDNTRRSPDCYYLHSGFHSIFLSKLITPWDGFRILAEQLADTWTMCCSRSHSLFEKLDSNHANSDSSFGRNAMLIPPYMHIFITLVGSRVCIRCAVVYVHTYARMCVQYVYFWQTEIIWERQQRTDKRKPLLWVACR